MIECRDCTELERRVSGLGADLRRAQDELDRATERNRELEVAEASPIDARDRHWYRLICDRCGASLSVASTLAIDDAEMRQTVGDLARRVRWALGPETARELLLAADGTRDRCPACVQAGAL